MQWYVINTKPQREDDVCKQLNQAAFETFNPKLSEEKLGATSRRTKSLFPSYIFTKANLNDAGVHHMIRFTRGVNKVLGSSGLPIAVDERIVSFIRDHINQNGLIERRMFNKGDKIRVKRGVLRDIEGILSSEIPESGRISVLLKIMQRPTKVWLSCSDIEQLHA